MGAVGLALGLAACGGPNPDDGIGYQESAACASAGTALGQRVTSAAVAGPSTVRVGDIDTKENSILSGPIIEGEALANAFTDLIRSAKREVFIQSLQIEEGSYSAARLKAAVQSVSVPVYVLFYTDKVHNPIPSFLENWRQDEVQRMSALLDTAHHKNIHVASFKASDVEGTNLIHSKTVVVDGARALVYTANLDTDTDAQSHPNGKGWFQLGVEVGGSVAASLRIDAASAWSHADPGSALPAAPPRVAASACNRVVVLGREAGTGENASADKGLAALFTGATSLLRVMSPNLNDDGALAALAAATAHAQVHVILSKGFNDLTEELPGQGGTNADNVTRLAKMAKNPKNLHIRWFSRTTNVAVNGNGAGASHVKFASADGHVMILGSQNLDTQSWKHSREVSIAIDNAGTTGQFDAVFDGVWNRSAVAY